MRVRNVKKKLWFALILLIIYSSYQQHAFIQAYHATSQCKEEAQRFSELQSLADTQLRRCHRDNVKVEAEWVTRTHTLERDLETATSGKEQASMQRDQTKEQLDLARERLETAKKEWEEAKKQQQIDARAMVSSFHQMAAPSPSIPPKINLMMVPQPAAPVSCEKAKFHNLWTDVDLMLWHLFASTPPSSHSMAWVPIVPIPVVYWSQNRVDKIGLDWPGTVVVNCSNDAQTWAALANCAAEYMGKESNVMVWMSTDAKPDVGWLSPLVHALEGYDVTAPVLVDTQHVVWSMGLEVAQQDISSHHLWWPYRKGTGRPLGYLPPFLTAASADVRGMAMKRDVFIPWNTTLATQWAEAKALNTWWSPQSDVPVQLCMLLSDWITCASMQVFVVASSHVHVPHQVQLKEEHKVLTTLDPANIASSLQFCPSVKPAWSVVWDTYWNGCVGFSSEAVVLAIALEPVLDLTLVANGFCQGHSRDVLESLSRMATSPHSDLVDIFISHKPPSRYPSFPYNGLVKIEKRPRLVIGRSMTEQSELPEEWKTPEHPVDEIWVPSAFLVDVFVRGGYPRSMLRVVPEAVDSSLYDPQLVASFPWGKGTDTWNHPTCISGDCSQPSFVFFSVFKMEPRKGYDVLVQSFARTFGATPGVCLRLLTYLYEGYRARDPEAIAQVLLKEMDNTTTPCIEIMSKEVPAQWLPSLYKEANAFVLPTRAEGWGLPVMEAMAMELPVIATDWSGPAEFITEHNAFPLRVERMVPVEEGSAAMWAEPSSTHLDELLEYVVEHPEEAKTRGKQARKDVMEKYSPAIVAQTMKDAMDNAMAKLT